MIKYLSILVSCILVSTAAAAESNKHINKREPGTGHSGDKLLVENKNSVQGNPAAVPVEYDTIDASWDAWKEKVVLDVDIRINELSDPAAVKIVFIGNSITHGWLVPGYSGTLWSDHFEPSSSPYYSVNLAVPGDRTENILYRLLSKADGGMGHLDNTLIDPEYVVLMIGTNNLWAYTPEQISGGIGAVIDRIKELRPDADIILCSVLPTDEDARNENIIIPVNDSISKLADQDADMTYLDLYNLFVNADGSQNKSLFRDGVHPGPAGYNVWYCSLMAVLDK